MEATLTITIKPRDSVPDGPERAQWLDLHGVPPETAQISVTLPLTTLANLRIPLTTHGQVDVGGRPDDRHYWPDAVRAAASALDWAASSIILAEGFPPGGVVISDPARVISEGQIARLYRPKGDYIGATSAVDDALAEINRRDEDARRRSKALDEIAVGGVMSLLGDAYADDYLAWRRRVATHEQLAAAEALRLERQASAAMAAKLRAEDDARQLTAWIGAHGTTSQIARHAEGLLPEEELLTALRDWIFAGLSGETRYKKIHGAEVDHAGECYQPEYRFGSDPAAALDEDEYAALQRIKQLAPHGATVLARVHYGQCQSECCTTRVVRCGALVAVTVLGRDLSREYAL